MRKNIEEMIKEMSLEEKVAQLCGIWITDLIENDEISYRKCKELIPYGIGHIGQAGSCTTYEPGHLAKLIDDLQQYVRQETKSKIPVLFHEEVITGIAVKNTMITPQMIGMGCSWNPQLVYENAKTIAKDMKKMGIYYALSPMVDVVTDPRWGRAEEGFGENPYLVGSFTKSFITGLQSESVAATAKHFAGYGADNEDVVTFLNDILFPFQIAIKYDVCAVMPGYHMYKEIPCILSEELLNQILREKLGFKNMIVSDYGAIKQAWSVYGYTKNALETASKALKSGVAVDLPKGEIYQNLSGYVKDGTIKEELVNEAVKQVLLVKEKTGLLDPPDKRKTYHLNLDTKQHRERALKSAHQSIVLLKNDAILPIDTNTTVPCILVTGPEADSCYSLLGDYTWAGIAEYFHRQSISRESPHLVTLLEGMKKRFAGKADILYERGCDWGIVEKTMNTMQGGDELCRVNLHDMLEKREDVNTDALSKYIEKADMIVAAVGENRYFCGEGCNRVDVGLPKEQEEFVYQLCKTGKPVIMVVFGGRPLAIEKLAEQCSAVIYAWYPGEEGGNAIADILSGKVCPSGKLCVTLPIEGDRPIDSRESLKKGSQYYFGYGLSYAEFIYHSFWCPEKVMMNEEYFDISFIIENIGFRTATEIGQVYMRHVDEEKKNLVGFVRTTIKKQKKRQIKIRIYTECLSEYDMEGRLCLKPGVWMIYVGASVRDEQLFSRIEIRGDETVFMKRKHDFSQVIENYYKE